MRDSIIKSEEADLGSLPASPPIDLGSQRRLGVVCLLVTAIGWALNWPSMKILLQEWPPLFSRGLAGVVAGLALAGLAAYRGQTLSVPRAAWPRLLAAAFTNVFAWMGFSSMCMKWVSVGEGALLVYTMPIWATLFAWPVLGNRPTARGFLALLLGLSGVGALLSGQGPSNGDHQTLGVVLALAAAILFALGTVLNGTPLPLPPLTSTAWQVGVGCLPMIFLGLAFEAPRFGALTRTGFISLAYMTIFPMGVCYLTWFAALRRLPPATASITMLLVPLLGVSSAAMMLGEPFAVREIVAMTLTLSGVALALRRG